MIADCSVPVCAGSLIYVRPATPYYFEGKLKVIVLNFDMTLNQSDQKEPINPLDTLNCFDPSRVFENDPPKELSDFVVLNHAIEIESKMQECRLHFCYPSSYSSAASSAIIKEILCYVAKKTEKQQKPLPELVHRVMLFIQQNYDRDLTNRQIADKFGYHSYYLNHVFKESTGMTLHQSVIAERITLAKQLLGNTELSVDAVSKEVGFSDRAHFSTAFKQHTGTTPSKYRTCNRQGL
jgi:AraC-like DNA-binding protein